MTQPWLMYHFTHSSISTPRIRRWFRPWPATRGASWSPWASDYCKDIKGSTSEFYDIRWIFYDILWYSMIFDDIRWYLILALSLRLQVICVERWTKMSTGHFGSSTPVCFQAWIFFKNTVFLWVVALNFGQSQCASLLARTVSQASNRACPIFSFRSLLLVRPPLTRSPLLAAGVGGL